ncbi:Gustatory and odorant receptor 24 [Frankliniella fusca]|uniref:Gustatory receptor n=1 Tax=Frankliniella fusca TaxID=407009 RepID=A0AAE1LSV4_9NEOP|nr:Gustatory and odorant receptor 24 [Frankliniella fusca]
MTTTRVGSSSSSTAAALQARTVRLFLALTPLYYTLIAYGVVPTTIRRWPRAALSFAPLRSTLMWAVLLHAAVAASMWRVYTASLVVLEDGAGRPIIVSYSTFPALLAIAHVAGCGLLLPIWWEAPRYKELLALARTLVGCLDDDDGVLSVDWPRRRTVIVSWIWSLALVLACPGVVIFWQFRLTEYGGEAIRVPAHWISNVLIAAIVSSLCLVYHIIRDVAEALAQRFAQEAGRAPPLSCVELLQYRRAWLTLRDMLQGAMFAPVSVTLCCTHLVVNNVLCMYHVLNSILGGAPPQLTLGVTFSTSQITLLLVVMCLAADGAVDAVAKFARSFESLEPNSANNFAFAREVFREALSHSPSPVCVGGFWYLNRRTVLSMCLMILTYLIVLVEFRQQDSCPHGGNATRLGAGGGDGDDA